MAAVRYYELIREMRSAYNHRLRQVEFARLRGLKPTARLFATSVPAVRKWLRLFQQRGHSALQECSRAPHRQSHNIPPELEQQVVALRLRLPTFGTRRLIREFDLPLSHRALERIWRAQRLLRNRGRKYQYKQDVAQIKAQWAVFQRISDVISELDDNSHNEPQNQRRGLGKDIEASDAENHAFRESSVIRGRTVIAFEHVGR